MSGTVGSGNSTWPEEMGCCRSIELFVENTWLTCFFQYKFCRSKMVGDINYNLVRICPWGHRLGLALVLSKTSTVGWLGTGRSLEGRGYECANRMLQRMRLPDGGWWFRYHHHILLTFILLSNCTIFNHIWAEEATCYFENALNSCIRNHFLLCNRGPASDM